MADTPNIPSEAETSARWGAMDFMSREHMLADTTAILGAMDIVFGECDR